MHLPLSRKYAAPRKAGLIFVFRRISPAFFRFLQFSSILYSDLLCYNPSGILNRAASRMSEGKPAMRNYDAVSSALLRWYDQHARVMPWRGIHDSYKTWVSETMLQQTRIETVIPYYHRFLERFPTLQDLAVAEEADVLKLWEGLGYYSRARNLLKGARQVAVAYQGTLPADPALLRKISGIGPYTAGAIASIAFQIPVPAVDGNVLRVYSRLFGIRENIRVPSVRRQLESIAAEAVSQDRPGDYNQAVMDLGATVCVPGTPDCDRCPLSALCDAFARGDASDLPVLPRGTPQKVCRYAVPVLLSGSRVLMRRRTEALLCGLWCFPLLECAPADLTQILAKKFSLTLLPAGSPREARHVFTHLIWEMTVVPFRTGPEAPAPGDYCWIPVSDIPSLAVPAAMNVPVKVAQAASSC